MILSPPIVFISHQESRVQVKGAISSSTATKETQNLVNTKAMCVNTEIICFVEQHKEICIHLGHHNSKLLLLNMHSPQVITIAIATKKGQLE